MKDEETETGSLDKTAAGNQTVDPGTMTMLAGQALPPNQASQGPRPQRTSTAPETASSDKQTSTPLEGDRGFSRPADAIRPQPADNAPTPKTATTGHSSPAGLSHSTPEGHAAYQAEASKANAIVQAGPAEVPAPSGSLTGTETPSIPPAASAGIATSTTGTTTSAPTAPLTAARHEITTPFGQRGWDQALSTRVLWAAQDQLQQASLTLNPPNLGPIQVMVQVDNQQAVVQFIAVQPEVRQALQEALPVLRDMFGQAGIELGQTNVSSGNSEQGAQQQASQNGRKQDDAPSILPLIEAMPMSSSSAGQGLINTFA